MKTNNLIKEYRSNYKDLGIEFTEKTKTLIIGDSKEILPVYKIPISLLKYNLRNGRIFSSVFNISKDKNLEDMSIEDIERYNDELQNLIWESNVQRNQKTLESIERHGQFEAGVVLTDNTVVDGNRRFTCLRKLNSSKPEEHEYFEAAILDPDEKDITDKDIRKFELMIQFGQDEKVDYSSLNKALRIYSDIEENSITVGEMADLIDEKKHKIVKMLDTVKLVYDFLDFINVPSDFEVAEELKIYFALEPLATYIKSNHKAIDESDLKSKKDIYFSYLASADFELPTQTLRDKLIKKIFKEPEYFEDFKTEFEENYAEEVYSQIASEEELESEQKIDRIKETRKSETGQNVKKLFDKYVNKSILKKNSEYPFEVLNNIIESLEDLNLEPLINAGIDDKLSRLNKLFQKTKNILNEKKSELSNE